MEPTQVKMKPWSKVEDDYLRDYVNQGLTARQIAARLGRSRNSIIGRTYRIGAWLRKFGTSQDIYGTSTKRRLRKLGEPTSEPATQPSSSKTTFKKVTGLHLRLKG